MLAVTTEKIIKKMLQEVKLAENKTASQLDMKKHVANIKLLCELLLEEDLTQDKESRATACTTDEWKMMTGNTDHPVINKKTDGHNIDHDGANGNSLFDF